MLKLIVMQFKLLQFYKVLSNFSTSLISAFVPLLIYQETGKIYLSVLCLLIQTTSNIVFCYIFKKWLYEKPQLCLMLRTIPIILMQVILVFLAKAPVLSVVGCGVFTGLNYTLKYIPSDIIFTYTTPPNANSKWLGISRLSEEVGYVLAGVLGGLFLDYIDYTIVIIISLGLYVISSLPLVIFYIKNRKVKNFNTEQVSNAFVHYEHKVKDGRGKKLSKKILGIYFVEYALNSGIDSIYALFGFMVYLNSGSFLLSGVLGGIFDSLYGISSMVIAKLDDKFDLTFWATGAVILMGICSVVMSFTAGSILSYICYELFAVLWPFPVIFVHQRLIMKTRILGINNDCAFYKYIGTLTGNSVAYAFGFISIPVVAIAALVMAVGGGAMVPITEEKTRQALVDYLENNEIAE